MWSKKKPVAAQAVDSEPTNLQTNQPTKFAPALWARTPKMNNAAIRSTGGTVDRVTSRLGVGLNIKGEISGNEDLHVDGQIDGLIRLDEGKLTVGTAAKVTADIVAGEVVVFGNMKGNVRAKNRIEIKKEGSITGDLTTPQILIEDGAFFKGSIEIGRSVEKEVPKSVFSQTASTSTPPKAAAAGTQSI